MEENLFCGNARTRVIKLPLRLIVGHFFLEFNIRFPSEIVFYPFFLFINCSHKTHCQTTGPCTEQSKVNILLCEVEKEI